MILGKTVTNQVMDSINTYVCPACKGDLDAHDQTYTCNDCDRVYPVFFGIPDFRLRSDRYLSLDDEREKALRIASKSDSGFSAMLDYYYQITTDVPEELATRYKIYHHNSTKQAKHSLEYLSITSSDRFLDIGCGTGGALIAAAEKTKHTIGVDIALRWLVICKQRLKEQGVNASLICADVESLPFIKQSFTKIMANDLLENVYSVERTLVSLNDQLQADGLLWLSGNNKYCLGPHPSTRLWAIGYFPKRIRSFIVKWLRGVDSLRFINLVSSLKIIGLAKKAGLQVSYLSPKIIQNEVNDEYPLIDRILIKQYITIVRIRFFKSILLLIGPAFEMMLYKSSEKNQQRKAN